MVNGTFTLFHECFKHILFNLTIKVYTKKDLNTNTFYISFVDSSWLLKQDKNCE